MNPILTVMLKELGESLRDAHVLLYAIGFPVLFYPMLLWGAVQLAQIQEGALEATPVQISVEGPEELVDALEGDGFAVGAGGREAVASGELDVAVIGVERGDALEVTLLHRSTSSRADRAVERVRTQLRELKSERSTALLERQGLDPAQARRWEVVSENVASDQVVSAYLLSQIVPVLVHVSLVLAVLYPAVEVVVGERERGTLETTLVAACPRSDVATGKLLSVMVIGLTAAIVNGLAVAITIAHASAAMGRALVFDFDTLPTLLSAATLLPTALLVTAVMVLAVLPTSSFKAGQNAGTAVSMVFSGMTVIGVLPLTPLNPATAALPLAGSVLVMRETMNGATPVMEALIAILSTGALAALTLRAVGRVIAREDFLFGDGRGWRWLLGSWGLRGRS